MLTRLTTLTVTALCAAGALASTAHAATGDLYVATTDAGTLQRHGAAGDYTLTLRSPSRLVTAFTDRPTRSSKAQHLRGFVADWAGNGFAADAPNAALVIDAAPRDRNVFVFTLSKPRIAKSGALVLRAHRVTSTPSGRLSTFAASASRTAAPRAFKRASLFIDAAADPVPVSVNISGLPAGQTAEIDFANAQISAPSADVPTLASTETATNVEFGPASLSWTARVQSAAGTARTLVVPQDSSGKLSGTLNAPKGTIVSMTVGNGLEFVVSPGAFSAPIS